MFIISKILALALLAGNSLTRAGTLPLAQRDPAPSPIAPSDLPAGWSYTGCYIDNVHSRLLSHAFQPSAVYSRVETCISFCSSQNLPIAGLEFGGECFCGAALPATAVADPTGCTTPCRGNITQACGAADRLSVYSGPPPAPGPVENPGVGGFVSMGCYTDKVDARTLSRQAAVSGGAESMTNAACAAACAGYQHYGVEYGGECFCGAGIREGAGPTLDGGCDMACRGEAAELCGGRDRINLYSRTASEPTPTTTTATAPVLPSPTSSCPGGKSANLCCRAIEPWKTNTYNWGTVCRYFPPNANELVGASCIAST